MADEMKIVVGIDASKAEQGAKQVANATSKMASAAKDDAGEVSQAFDEAGKAAENLGEAITNAASDTTVFQKLADGIKGGLSDAFSGGFIGGLVGGGVADLAQNAIGAVADGFGAIIEGGRELIGAQGDLQAATGASGAEFEQLKKSAEDAFLGGVGGSLAEATKAIANAKGALKDALPNEEIGTFVKNSQALATLYDKDVNEVVSKSAPFVRQFGLEGEKAFNLIAFASKEGKTASDDTLDTLAEYSQLLQEAGFSAEEFAGQIAIAGQEGLFNTDKIGDSIKEAQIRLKAGDTSKAIADLQGSLPKAFGATLKELEGLASSGQISIKEFLQRSGGAIEEAFSAGDISEAMRSQLQVAIAGTPAEDLGAEAYGRMFGAPIPKEEIAAKALQAGKEAQNAAGQYLTFDTFTKQLELNFQKASAVIVGALDSAFKILSPVLTFVLNNLGMIATVVGVIAGAFAAYTLVVQGAALATAAYTAIQSALGGSISIATVAQYAWNLAMSLNPVGAIVAGVVLLTAGVIALADAMSISTEEAADQAQANKELIESQKKTNEENTTLTKGTKSMADEYTRLAEKKKLTSAETARMKQLQQDLNKQYPDLVKNTGSFKDNLDGVKQVSEQAGNQLNKLAQESAQLDKSLAIANQNLAYAQRNVAIASASEVFTDIFGTGVLTSEASDQARAIIKNYADILYQANVTEAQIRDAQSAASSALSKIQVSDEDKAKALGFISDAAIKGIGALKAFDIQQKASENVTTTTTNKITEQKKDSANAQLAAIESLVDAEDKFKSKLEDAALIESENGEISKAKRRELIELEKKRLETLLNSQGQYVDFYKKERGNLVDIAKVTIDANGKVISGIKGTKEEQQKAAEEFEKIQSRLIKINAELKKTNAAADIEAYKTKLDNLKKSSEDLRKAVPEKLSTKYAFTVTVEDYEKEIKDIQDKFIKLNDDLTTATINADEKQSAEITKQLDENKKIQLQIEKDYQNTLARIKIEKETDTDKRVLDVKLLDLKIKFEKEQEENKGNFTKLEELENAYLSEREKLQEEYDRKSNIIYGVQSAVQSALQKQFNIARLMEERKANQDIRDEKLKALQDEESDLETSLANREISFQEYQDKLAELNQRRIDEGLVQEKLGDKLMKDLKIAGDQAFSQIATDQGNKLLDAAKARGEKQIVLDAKVADAQKELLALKGKGTLDEFAKAQENLNKAQEEAAKNDESVYGFRTSVLEEFAGNALQQFATLAASGKATLADFAKVTVQLAFEALQKMIPIFVAEIAGNEFAKGIGGIATTAILTAALYGLFAQAQSSAGFKDGVVDLEGAGTETSDSIPAWLSKGESVITAKATRENKTELEWLNKTGLPLREFYRNQFSSTSINADGELIREIKELRKTTEGLGMQINRNTHVKVDGVLVADGDSITAMIESNRKRNARRY